LLAATNPQKKKTEIRTGRALRFDLFDIQIRLVRRK
jgi:hypothetical protein